MVRLQESRYDPPISLRQWTVSLEGMGDLGQEIIRWSMSSIIDVIDEFFEDEHVRTHMLAQSTYGMLFPDQPGHGMQVLLRPSLQHTYGVGIQWGVDRIQSRPEKSGRRERRHGAHRG